MTGKPYWTDGRVTLYHGDCREVTEWLAADVLVTDPPYGRGWKQGDLNPRHIAANGHVGIRGDRDTAARDEILAAWGSRPALMFGDLTLAPPSGNRQTLVYRKPPGSGARGAIGGWRRDAEAIYVLGTWSAGMGGRSSVLASGARVIQSPTGLAGRYGHPHAKPVDVMEALIAACPPGVIADPFAGSGSALIAARNQGRHVIGVEIEERYCEQAARRLSQADLFGPAA